MQNTQKKTKGRAELPLCPNLTGSKRNDAGSRTGKNITSLVLAEIWAARQHRPTN
ncbi:MAG: hypothetical protein ACLPYZ_04030 [Limisphaerales bacterium]